MATPPRPPGPTASTSAPSNPDSQTRTGRSGCSENKYPRLADEPPPAGLSGAFRAQTNTYGFGPLEPGEEKEAVWPPPYRPVPTL